MHRYIAFNWKMNPPSLAEAQNLFSDTRRASERVKQSTVVVCPPFEYLFQLSSSVVRRQSFVISRSSSVISHQSSVSIGAQNCFWETSGAYTGEVSPLALKQAGISYVILGHSERALLGETDEMVAKKIVQAVESGLTPIVCFGEDGAMHEKGRKAIEKFLSNQITARLDLARTMPSHQKMRMLLTYEPVWAISTQSGNIADTHQDSREVIVWMKQKIQELCSLSQSVPVLYGGSVNAKNVESFCQEPSIDGFLVGHASLNSAEVKVIIDTAEKY